jgi:hypothetical protein
MKILHISFYITLHYDIIYIINELNKELEVNEKIKLSFMEFNDGTRGKYNIGHERAEKYWNKHKDYFNKFDIIIVSETTPISRVFLQNNYNGKLIIWISNRFDYCDMATNDCNFPDEEYYDIFKKAINNNNVKIISSTEFENYYCRNVKCIDICNTLIKPIGCINNIYSSYNVKKIKNKNEIFIVGNNFNETKMINLKEKLNELNISVYNSNLVNPCDIIEFKGIIHIPHTWSSFELFRNIQLGVIYFIPSYEFLLELKKENKNFYWTPPYSEYNLNLSEWYNDINKNCFVYFDSWDDLINKIDMLNYAKKKEYLLEFGEKHKNKMIKLWKKYIYKYYNYYNYIMKILHISFHNGCHNEITFVMDKLKHKLFFLPFDDGTKGKYNIGHERAEKYWNEHKDYFNKFDLIITSDTAPISRVFLQNGWTKPLIIWINNRFDYTDQATNDCNFPDDEYYNLFREAVNMENVKIIGYTEFENYYCREIRGIDIGNNVIKPIGCVSDVYNNKNLTKIEFKSDTVFVGPYHNDNIMMNLTNKLKELNIPVYNGRFNGPYDLAEFRCVVHIPYAWSNYSLFEGIQSGIVYFIPSKDFLIKLKKDKDFFWSPPYSDDNLHLAEWYNDENKDCFVYFRNWDDLKIKIFTTNYVKKKEYLKKFGEEHKNKMLELWSQLI